MPPEDEVVAAGEDGTNPTASPDKPARKRRLDVNPDLILSAAGRSKRRRTPTPPPEKPNADPQDPERAKALGYQLYNKILNLRDEDDESMAEPFMELPSKNEFPDYYETIKHPMSLEMVRDKLDRGQYTTLGQVTTDMGTIWNNAKRYNMSESLLFQWARHMHKITRNFLASHTQGHDGSESEEDEPAPPRPLPPRKLVAPPPPAIHVPVPVTPNAAAGPSTPQSAPKTGGPGTGRKRGSYMKDGPTVYKLIKPCMRAIKDAKSDDGTGREIATAFMSLPDRRSFPDYYRLIKHPLTLLDIENRMIARRFETADHFFDEIDKLCANAEAYNQDHSEIWIDAQQIRGIVSQHRDLAKERIAAPRNSQGKPLNPPSATSTPIRHPGMMVPQGPGGAAPPLAPHQMMLPPDIRAAYAQQVNYAYGTPPGRSQQLPMVSPQAQVQQLPQAAYLPALPHGMVTEETVASLERYPPFQQQAWLNSLPPLAKTAYHQITAINEARKRGVAPPPPPEPVAVPEPATPRDPTIKHIDFTCNASTLRLENVRGILTHAVAVAAGNAGADLRLELTAWIDTSAEPAASPRKQPDLALKVNGAPSAAAMTKVLGGGKDAPTGVRWTVPVSGNDAKIELVATRPGALIETSAIFVNRQY